jgi:hypothetical protein
LTGSSDAPTTATERGEKRGVRSRGGAAIDVAIERRE